MQKNVIYSYEPNDWFDQIPLGALCGGGLTAINVDRRFGKTCFVTEVVKRILEMRLSTSINIYCLNFVQAELMKKRLHELGKDSENGHIQIFPNPSVASYAYDAMSHNKRGCINIIDEDVCSDTHIRRAIKSELFEGPDTWIFIGTSYEYGCGRTKNAFAGLLEMPFVKSFEIVGKIPDEVMNYLSIRERKAIKERYEVYSDLDPERNYTPFFR